MPIVNTKDWETYVRVNDDFYGKACVDVARKVMRLLDERGVFDAHDIISEASRGLETGGISGFQAGAVASMVSGCHSRGDEFRRAWNLDTAIGDEGAAANESGGVLNPAVLTFKAKE